jgi:hypothetical protein
MPTTPKCPQRGRIISDDRCYCRHPKVTGPRRKSTPVPLSKCETCPVPQGGEPVQLTLPEAERITVAPAKQPKLLGDMVESALTKVGVTKERVTKWIGAECGCAERQEKLNRLHLWAKGVLSGKSPDATAEFEQLTSIARPPAQPDL